MKFPTDISTDINKRLRRLEGQGRGLQRMIDEGADCKDIVTQLSAAQGALNRVGFKLMSAAMIQSDESTDMDELERLFLKLS